MTVLVISPHPDDEALGCGGAVRGHVLQGDTVHVVFLTSGEAGGHGRDPASTARAREAEARAAGAVLGTSSSTFLRQPDGRLRCTHHLVQLIADALTQFGPEMVYAPHAADGHPDHRVAHIALKRALSTPARQERPQVRCYEVWTPVQQITAIVDITDHMATKLAAVRAHESQCAVMRFDEAMTGLARFRGEMHSWPGGPYAEVFAGMRP